MPIIEVEALVLETREYRETSLLATLLTRGRGRVSAIAKGARRKGSDLAGAVQPFNLLRVRLSVRDAGGLATLISADLRIHPDYARCAEAPLARIAHAGLVAEVLTHSHENDPHAAELFDLARDFFLGLREATYPGSFALRGCFALLATLGFALEPPPATPDGGADDTIWHMDLLHGVPRRGRASEPAAGSRERGNVVYLDNETFEALRAITRASGHPLSPADGPVVGTRAGRNLMRLAIRLFETHLETRLHSAKFLEEMVLKC